MKRLSILGIILTGASAVVAAVMPSKANSDAKFAVGDLTLSSGGLDITCLDSVITLPEQQCSWTNTAVSVAVGDGLSGTTGVGTIGTGTNTTLGVPTVDTTR